MEERTDINRRFFNNLKFAMDNKNIRVGYIEKSVGVRLGYIARKSRDGTDIPLPLAVALADAVEEPIALLLDERFKDRFEAQRRAKELKDKLETIEAQATELDRTRERIKEELKQAEDMEGGIS